ncbi:MAG: MATE family efflux transporter [Sneathiellaceae bacterium]
MTIAATAGTAPQAGAALPPRTRMLLSAPVLPTLLRLAAPNLGEAAARVTFIACDAVFVAWLGEDALAGVSLVFPLLIVMQTVSAGGLGVGVAAAVARALGAGQVPQARALVGAAAAMALLLGLLSAALLVPFGPALYGAMGLSGAALEAAVDYGALVFGGAVLVWLMNLLANTIRGTGNMLVPALAIVAGEACHLALSPALILGWGPFPEMGVAGAAIGVLAAYGVGAALLLAWLASPRALLRLQPGLVRLRAAPVRAILQVGGPAALNALQFQLQTFLVAALAAGLGAGAVAAYGVASRLELLLLPITFAFGSALVTLVATATGAGDAARARRIALCGACIAFGIGCLFAAIAYLAPALWMGLFTDQPALRDLGMRFLSINGFAWPFFAAGLALYFALQGAGDAKLPFLMGLGRLVVAVGGGWLALALAPPDWQVDALFAVLAAASLLFSLGIAWRSRRIFVAG